LNRDRDVHLRLGEAALGAVEHRTCTEQRRPAAPHRIDQRFGTKYPQERLVHPRERGGLGVLGRRGRADRNRDALVAPGQLLVGHADLTLEPAGERLGADHPAYTRGHLCERRGVVDLQPL